MSFINYFIKDEKLPSGFFIKIFNKLDKTKIKNNPQKAKISLLTILKEEIHSNIIQKIEYSFSYSNNEVTIFQSSLHSEDGKYLAEIPYTCLGKFIDKEISAKESFLYDNPVYDSNIEKDSITADPDEVNDRKITVFAKLPKIKIPTPYKEYNPDFAYLLEGNNGKKFFFVVETKGYQFKKDISKEEKNKIEYAKRFFKKLNEEVKEVEIIYKERLNKQELSKVLKINGLNDV